MGLLGCEWVTFHLLIDLLDHFLIHLPLLVKHITTLFILNLTRILCKAKIFTPRNQTQSPNTQSAAFPLLTSDLLKSQQTCTPAQTSQEGAAVESTLRVRSAETVRYVH